jgi:hypothetical protein
MELYAIFLKTIRQPETDSSVIGDIVGLEGAKSQGRVEIRVRRAKEVTNGDVKK